MYVMCACVCAICTAVYKRRNQISLEILFKKGV